jgi:transketolase
VALKIEELKELARQFRRDILEMIYLAGSGHPGGSLSAVEILIALYYHKLNIRPEDPALPLRDRFIMSKGHASPGLYTVLANRGFFPKEELKTFRKLGSRLQGHVYKGVPGVELSTGSLGQGLSVACGIALGAKVRKVKFRIYCLVGDGEIQEGQIWEAAMTAGQHKLDNLVVILDANKVQENDLVEKIKNEEPTCAKWRDFGFHCIEIDGHDFEQIMKALDEADTVKERPTFIKANTIKGKGVSFMEGSPKWHGKAPNKEQFETALKELGF